MRLPSQCEYYRTFRQNAPRAGRLGQTPIRSGVALVDDLASSSKYLGRKSQNSGHESDTDVWQVCSLPAKPLISERLKRSWEGLL
jgi:hypothetical protein